MIPDLQVGLLLGIILGIYIDRSVIPEIADAIARHARRVRVRADER